MLSSLVLSFREGFEAVLVIGIILTYLKQTNKEKLAKFVYYGTILGILVGVIGGYIGFKEAQELEEEGDALFEAIMMLVASGLIGYFVVWMSNQNKNISQSIKSSVDKTSTGFGLFILAFLSVFREGIELIAFILTKVSEKASSVAAGTGIGIILAVLLGYALFKTSVKFNIKIVFKVLGIILIFVGAELFGEGFSKLIPTAGEFLEEGGAILFGGASLIYFLKEDFKRLFSRN
ncbi:FTR1 family protein [Clostridium sp. YIM B02551]|uniref:FTR1 family iron permease n=1 Tax=Clostridium sp. YIM B02551 TaxID=2910679 RepID=UPI001EEBEBEB|nr:FTR1 family protein [Clostridium sp. YIM B02551]